MLKGIIGRCLLPAQLGPSPPYSSLLWIALALLFAPHVSGQTASPSAQSSPPQQRPGSESTAGVTTLELGQSTDRELRGGEKHSYSLSLSADQYAQVTVQQRGVDVVVHLFGANGQLVADINAAETSLGSERLELVAETAGTYQVEISPSLPNASAGVYVVQLSDVHSASANEKLLYEARKQYYEALRLGAGDKAIELASHALEIREKILAPEHIEVVASLRLLGNLYARKNNLDKGDALLQRAAEVTLKTSGETLGYADILRDLCRTRFFRGDYTQADQLNAQALAIRHKLMGPDSLPVSDSLFLRATIARAANNYPKAEQDFRSALAIREKLLGPDDPAVANVLNDLGLFYYGAGDYDNAEPFLQRALAIREKTDPNSLTAGLSLNNLGLLEWKRHNYDRAETYYRRALNIFEKVTGPESDRFAGALANLGIIYKEAQDYLKAEECYQKALAIWEKLFGENHPSTANVVASLGILYRYMGDYERAEKFGLRAQTINEKVLGPNHPDTVRSLSALANLYATKGDVARSLDYQKRIRAIEERIIPLNQTLGSERQKIAYFAQLPKPDRVISFHVRLAHDNAEARDLAATEVLERKGRVLDALSDNLSALRRRSSAQDQALLDSLGDINAQLSKLVLSGPQRKSLEEHQNQIKALDQKREDVEAEVGRRSAGFYERTQPLTLTAIQALIPGNAALIEYAIYRPFDWKTDDNLGYGEPHYVVYVVRNRGDVRWAELGAAKDIDEAIDAWRQALRDPQRTDVRQLARLVDEKVMQPVRGLLGEATQILVSPDGELNLIPFAALVNGEGHYLLEQYALSYLTSGRELLRLQTRRESKNSPVLIANPTFGEPTGALLAKSHASIKARDARRRTMSVARDLSELYFSPLAGTGLEAHTIQMLFPDADLLTGLQATESAIKQVAAPNILHIATHGFFLSDPAAVATRQTAQVTTRGISANATIENPLLRSGLALANANLRSAGIDDGILTALEASGLNLWGTKLVVLSACDTGVGEVRSGEGLYGLRRAFVLAGAESLVMSLWPISDYSTRQLMTNYYKNLKQGLGRGESLRRVQIEMLKRNPHLHPFYWANFIQSGEWASLDGRR